jgi:hypothetical protein
VQLVAGVVGAVDRVEHVAPPEDALTTYSVIVAPPLSDGGLQVTTADMLPRTAATSLGWPGTVLGVTELDAADGLPAPAAFVATTANV